MTLIRIFQNMKTEHPLKPNVDDLYGTMLSAATCEAMLLCSTFPGAGTKVIKWLDDNLKYS